MSEAELKKVLGTDKAVIGARKVRKIIKGGSLDKVYLASNCPVHVKDDFRRYSAVAGFELETMSIPNEELGVICKKPFPVSVIAKKK